MCENMPPRRQSLSSNKHHSSLSSIDPTQLLPLEADKIKKSLEIIHNTVRAHLKEKKYVFEETELKELYKILSYALKNLPRLSEHQTQLKADLARQKEEKDQAIKQISSHYEDTLRANESENSHKIMQLTAEFGQQEQACKLLIANCMQALSKTQRSFHAIHSQITDKCTQATLAIQSYAEVNAINHQTADFIRELIEGLSLKDNSMISSKSDEISIDQIEISKDISRNTSRHNSKQKEVELIEESRFEGSSIKERSGDEDNAEKLIEESLMKLIAFGFFSRSNCENVMRLISMSSVDHLSVLAHHKYPILLQMIKLALQPHEANAWQLLHGNVEATLGEIGVELRNVQNISELSIVESERSDRRY